MLNTGFPIDNGALSGKAIPKEGLSMTAEFDVRQGQQDKKRRSMPLKCDADLTCAALWNLFSRTGLPEAYLLYRKTLGTQ